MISAGVLLSASPQDIQNEALNVLRNVLLQDETDEDADTDYYSIRCAALAAVKRACVDESVRKRCVYMLYLCM